MSTKLKSNKKDYHCLLCDIDAVLPYGISIFLQSIFVNFHQPIICEWYQTDIKPMNFNVNIVIKVIRINLVCGDIKK